MRIDPVTTFAARRRTDQADMEKDLFADVADAMQHYPAQGWYNNLLAEVARLYVDTYHREGGTGTPRGTDAFVRQVRDTLDKTTAPNDTTVDRVSVWLATAILNAATMEATSTDEEFLVMEWVTMHDADVRPTHREVEGQQRPPGEPFDVGGQQMPYPGYPGVDPALWMNCRCTLAPVLATMAAKEETMTAATDEAPAAPATPTDAVPWYGVLAPEGVWSGDKRMFSPGALRFRDLPLPMTWQKTTDEGHKGSVTVSKIEAIARVGQEMRATGHFLMSPEADEAIGLVAEFGRYGVSVDADDAEYEFGEGEEDGKVTFSTARISSAAMVPIPAFAEAFIALGDAPANFMDGESDTDDCDPTDPDGDCYDPAAVGAPPKPMSVQAFVSDKPWSNFKKSDYTPEQWKAACILHIADPPVPMSNHKVPVKEPGGALNRNGVHAAAAALGGARGGVNAPAEKIASAKRALRGLYSQIGEDPPDSLKAEADPNEVVEAGRGPGWITNPEDTRRIHDYWTKPGQPGYLKINWGVSGDFNRCRVQVGEEIGENSPEKLRFINQICAQWHHDALGYWPGRPNGGQTHDFSGTEAAPAVSLVAGGYRAPADWFSDPDFTHLTPVEVTEDGHVFGHLAGWSTCHTAFTDQCVAPPSSPSHYAYFLTGQVLTDAGPVNVGPLTVGTGHADARLGMRAAIAHYDHTGTAVADVTCGEDDYGIWVAGWIRPTATPEQVYALRAAALSGDWRTVNGDLELCAALAVNTPGFPVPRVGVAAGVQVALVAAGVVPVGVEPDLESLAAQLEATFAARAARRERMAELRQRIGG